MLHEINRQDSPSEHDDSGGDPSYFTEKEGDNGCMGVSDESAEEAISYQTLENFRPVACE